jgi:hypothetical protein
MWRELVPSPSQFLPIVGSCDSQRKTPHVPPYDFLLVAHVTVSKNEPYVFPQLIILVAHVTVSQI